MKLTKSHRPGVVLATVEKRIDQEARRLLGSESGRLFEIASGRFADASVDQRRRARLMIRMVMLDPNLTAMTRLVIARANEISIGLSEFPTLQRRISNQTG